MKLHYKAFFIVAVFIAVLMACKLDDPVMPSSPDILPPNNAIVKGITINKDAIDDDYLTGVWKTTSTTQQYYDTSRVVLYGLGVDNKFNGVTLNDKEKTYKYNGLASPLNMAEGTYRLFTDQNILFIEIKANPFFDQSKNAEIRITNLTTTDMTWLILNTDIILYNTKPARLAYQITFIRQP